MEIENLTKEELKFIVENYEAIKDKYTEYKSLEIGDSFFYDFSDNNKDAYSILIVTDIRHNSMSNNEDVFYKEYTVYPEKGIYVYSNLNREFNDFMESFKNKITNDNVVTDIIMLLEEQQRNVEKIKAQYAQKANNLLKKANLI